MNRSSIRFRQRLYNTNSYWEFSLHPSSRVLKNTKEHTILETTSVSNLRWQGGKHPLCWVHYKELTPEPLSHRPNRVGVSHRHLRMEMDPVSEMLHSLEYHVTDKVQKPSNPEGRMTDECWNGKDLEGSSHGLIKVLSQDLSKGNEESHEKPQWV
jgi:hypothetical protein